MSDGQPITVENGQDILFEYSINGITGTPMPSVPAKVVNGRASVTIEPPLALGEESFYATLIQSGVRVGVTAQAGVAARPTSLISGVVGNYVFTLNTASGTGPGSESVSVGSLSLSQARDGSGQVSGEFDYNGRLGIYQALPVTGTFTVDPRGLGTITLQSTAGTQHLNLYFTAGQLAGSLTLPQAVISEVDAPFIAGTGQIIRRAPDDPLFSFAGSLLSLAGRANTAAGPVTVTLSGLAATGTAATLDESLGSTVRRGAAVSVNLGQKDAQNRFAFTLTDPAEPALPRRYVGYSVNGLAAYVISLDPPAGTALLSGQVIN